MFELNAAGFRVADTPLLHAATTPFAPGQVCRLIEHSGSNKYTQLKLLARHQHVSQQGTRVAKRPFNDGRQREILQATYGSDRRIVPDPTSKHLMAVVV
ncbi:hypothetical protein HXW73_16770 [Halomonas sp. SH5A2]|uniref:hypothetical protein n=1 Tax=Halomonas sp. SH5A2 TaxID=2749040 RepID=UPI001641DE3C|nr:hypothetical protein [Halomonas sp. SH5A2]QNI04460.1 hypothetical protein HXW73_16770 [Halomonas sp. SH5A2]